MTQISRLEFRNVLIDGTNHTLNTVTYSRENLSVYFSLQSVAQCINVLIAEYGAEHVFHTAFFSQWRDLKLQCLTEFQLQLLVPINLILEQTTALFNPMPLALSRARYLNDDYHDAVEQYAAYTSVNNDVFCIAEKQNLTVPLSEYRHLFMNAIGFLSLIPLLRLRYIRKLYKTFFLVDMLYSADIEYIHETLILNRKRMSADDVANVFQLTTADVTFEPLDLTPADKEVYVARFNRACRVFKTFAFNIMDEQSVYISRNLQIMTQFGLDRAQVETAFRKIPPASVTANASSQLTAEQYDKLCRPPSTDPLVNLNATEVRILHSVVRIHLMIQRMTNVRIAKRDLEFYRNLLQTHYSVDLEEMIFDPDSGVDTEDICRGYSTLNERQGLVKNYTMGEIIGEFMQLYLVAQQNVNTVWLCRFVQMACNPRYSNLVNIMADFVPYFQRFFTNDFNINSVNNIIVFLQGMCRPDEDRLHTLKDFRELKQMDVRNFKSFSLTRYQAVNSNPLVTFVELLLSTSTSSVASRHTHNAYTINMNMLGDEERYNLISLIDPHEKEFIDYIYDLVTAAEEDDDRNNNDDDDNGGGFCDIDDLSGDRRFNLQYIDYDSLVPIVSTSTFNENNTTEASLQLFNGTINQSTFFHELTNRVTYKVPGVVCNIVIK